MSGRLPCKPPIDALRHPSLEPSWPHAGWPPPSCHPSSRSAPPPTDFGGVAVGSTANATVTVTATRAVRITAITAAAPFGVTAPALPVGLTTGQTLAVPVRFTPAAAGGAAGSLTFTTDAGNVTDADANTYWESADNAFPQWLQADLGATTAVSRVVLRLPPAAAWAARTETVTVTGFATGAVLVAGRACAFDPATGNTVTLTFPAAGVRYLRVTITGNTGWPAGQLSELEVYTS